MLDHFYHELNMDIAKNEDPIQVKLLCGGDLLDSFTSPGVWAVEDVGTLVTFID